MEPLACFGSLMHEDAGLRADIRHDVPVNRFLLRDYYEPSYLAGPGPGYAGGRCRQQYRCRVWRYAGSGRWIPVAPHPEIAKEGIAAKARPFAVISH